MKSQIADGARNQFPRIEKAEGVGLLQSPCKEDGRGDFIELFTVPVGIAIDPTVLRDCAIVVLQAGAPNPTAKRCAELAGGKQCGGALDHVARPNEVVSAEINVALVFAPRNAHGRSEERRVG